MKQLTAIYPGTFDPITNGHADIIERASRLFSQVIVAVAENQDKQPFFDTATRIQLIEAAVSELGNVSVCGFDNLLIDFAKAQNAQVIVRGLRAVSDFEYEFQLAGMNRRLEDKIETIFLSPSEQYMFISSSLVKEIARLGGDVSRFVSAPVMAVLKERI